MHPSAPVAFVSGLDEDLEAPAGVHVPVSGRYAVEVYGGVEDLAGLVGRSMRRTAEARASPCASLR